LRIIHSIVTINECQCVTIESKLEAASEAADEYLFVADAMVIMDPYEAEALMRFTASLYYKELSSKAYTLIDMAVSRNFVSKGIVVANGFYYDYKTAPSLSTRVANEQHIYTAKVFHPTVFTINGHEFTYLQFRVLRPHFKDSYNILGLPALKELNVVSHLIPNSFTMGDCALHCDRESRGISCLLVESNNMYQIIVRQARNKKNPIYIFLIYVHFVEELKLSKVILENNLTNNSNAVSRNLRI
jgi:hypothetical protein